jgi:hypothetical protein
MGAIRGAVGIKRVWLWEPLVASLPCCCLKCSACVSFCECTRVTTPLPIRSEMRQDIWWSDVSSTTEYHIRPILGDSLYSGQASHDPSNAPSTALQINGQALSAPVKTLYKFSPNVVTPDASKFRACPSKLFVGMEKQHGLNIVTLCCQTVKQQSC